MSEMIERVAKAIEGRTLKNQVQRHDASNPYCPCPMCQARAAIEAMREPTEAMIEHIRKNYELDGIGIAEEWRAMIDAALK